MRPSHSTTARAEASTSPPSTSSTTFRSLIVIRLSPRALPMELPQRQAPRRNAEACDRGRSRSLRETVHSGERTRPRVYRPAPPPVESLPCSRRGRRPLHAGARALPKHHVRYSVNGRLIISWIPFLSVSRRG